MKDVVRAHATPCGACGGLEHTGTRDFFPFSIIVVYWNTQRHVISSLSVLLWCIGTHRDTWFLPCQYYCGVLEHTGTRDFFPVSIIVVYWNTQGHVISSLSVLFHQCSKILCNLTKRKQTVSNLSQTEQYMFIFLSLSWQHIWVNWSSGHPEKLIRCMKCK